MPNLDSAKKRLRKDKVREAHNKQTKSRMRTAVKKVDAAIASGDLKAAAESLPEAFSQIAKTAKKGAIHKRTASRKQSRLAKRLHKAGLAKAAPAPAAKSPAKSKTAKSAAK